MKKWSSFLLMAVILLSLAGCKTNKSESSQPGTALSKLTCNIVTISGPMGVGLAPLMQKAENGNTEIPYNFSTVDNDEEIAAMLTSGKLDIAAMTTNLASSLYQKTNGGIQVLAVNTLGFFCVVTKGIHTSDLKSLRGSTVYATGQNADGEFIINYLLEQHNLTVGQDVRLKFVSEPAELVSVFMQNEKAIAVAPQPVATTITTKAEDAEIVVDLNNVWDEVSHTKLVMGCVAVRKAYLKKHRDAVEQFLTDYQKSIETIHTDSASAGKLCEKYGILENAAIAQKAIPYCHIIFETGQEMKRDLSAYLQFLYDHAPSAVGGALPNNDFYYETAS